MDVAFRGAEGLPPACAGRRIRLQIKVFLRIIDELLTGLTFVLKGDIIKKI